MADADVAARMFDARQALETRERGRLTLEELGRRIATEEGRPEKPYAAAVVKRWLEGDAEPGSMDTWRAIARVFGVRVGWLANGELPISDNEGDQGAKVGPRTPIDPPAPPPKRTPPPLREPEVLERHLIRAKKKATPKRRRGDRSAVA